MDPVRSGTVTGAPATAAPPWRGHPQARQAARDFEALFLRQLLSTMRRASLPGAPRSSGQRLYQELMDDELARTLARGGGLGLSDLLMRDLTGPKNASSPPPPRSMNRSERRAAWEGESP